MGYGELIVVVVCGKLEPEPRRRDTGAARRLSNVLNERDDESLSESDPLHRLSSKQLPLLDKG